MRFDADSTVVHLHDSECPPRAGRHAFIPRSSPSFAPRSFRWGNPFASGNRIGMPDPVGAGASAGRRRRALLQAGVGVSIDNSTVELSCSGEAACDWARRVSDPAANPFDGYNNAALAGWDIFIQTLFWFFVVFTGVVLLHLLVVYVIWPRHRPMPAFRELGGLGEGGRVIPALNYPPALPPVHCPSLQSPPLACIARRVISIYALALASIHCRRHFGA